MWAAASTNLVYKHKCKQLGSTRPSSAGHRFGFNATTSRIACLFKLVVKVKKRTDKRWHKISESKSNGKNFEETSS